MDFLGNAHGAVAEIIIRNVLYQRSRAHQDEEKQQKQSAAAIGKWLTVSMFKIATMWLIQ